MGVPSALRRVTRSLSPFRFVVNVVGCFALGYVLYAVRLGTVSEKTRVFTATGFVSSFTTYSTFAVDVFVSRPGVAVVYIAASYVSGFAAVAVGSGIAIYRTEGTA
nr:CrcB family protein [Halorutilus salinus]